MKFLADKHFCRYKQNIDLSLQHFYLDNADSSHISTRRRADAWGTGLKGVVALHRLECHIYSLNILNLILNRKTILISLLPFRNKQVS